MQYTFSGETNLGDFDDIKKECEHLTFILEMDCPSNKSSMIRRGPCIGSEMQTSRVVLISS